MPAQPAQPAQEVSTVLPGRYSRQRRPADCAGIHPVQLCPVQLEVSRFLSSPINLLSLLYRNRIHSSLHPFGLCFFYLYSSKTVFRLFSPPPPHTTSILFANWVYRKSRLSFVCQRWSWCFCPLLPAPVLHTKQLRTPANQPHDTASHTRLRRNIVHT